MPTESSVSLRQRLRALQCSDVTSFRPIFFDLKTSDGVDNFNQLLDKESGVQVFDKLESQIKELFKIRSPKEKLSPSDLDQKYLEWVMSNEPDKYGLWVFYPWNKHLVHIVPKDEYIELRTSRNQYKITPYEQETLSTKSVGVIGLSVGQSVAVTLAIERLFGTIKLADFDELELTNLNRIRAGVAALGLPKVIITAREIAEIDPFLNVELYQKGVTEETIDDFLGGTNPLDLLIEECDSLDIKILARLKAKEKGIPVLMDTSDRGMIDIERFDEEPDRDILHGKVKIDDVKQLKGLSYEEKVPFILEMVGIDKMSNRLKSSMLEIEQTLTTWPQLAGEVALGGALCAEISRELLLGKEVPSGRFYFDFKEFINPESKKVKDKKQKKEEPNYADLINQIDSNKYQVDELSDERIKEIVDSCLAAPSAGNVQPWKIFHKENLFYVFLDPDRIDFFGDYNRFASLLSVGAMLENVEQVAAEHGCQVKNSLLPLGDDSLLAMVFGLKKSELIKSGQLYPFIHTRHTNRDIIQPAEKLPTSFVDEIFQLNKENESFDVLLINQPSLIHEIADFVALADAQRLLLREGHEGFYKEIRWSDREAKLTGDGIDIETVDVAPSELAGFRIAQDWDAVDLLSQLKLGKAFGNLSKKAINSSSAILHISAKDYDKEVFIKGGMLTQKTWLLAEQYNVAYQPLLSTCLFNNWVRHGNREEVPNQLGEAMQSIAEEYNKVFYPVNNNQTEVFLARLSVEREKVKPAYRRRRPNIYQKL